MVPTQTLPRFQVLRFPREMMAKNRVVVPPMASATADSMGLVTAQTLAHYERLGRSGAGIVFVEYSFVSLSGRSEDAQLGAHDDACLPGLSALAQGLKRQGVLAGIQLTHAGGKTSRGLTGGVLLAPSAVAVPVKGAPLETPDEMSVGDLEILIGDFLAAARRAEQAGFDIIELHAAHGYGLNQWLSPLTNHRRDAWGGTAEKRSRLLETLVSELSRRLQRALLAVRMPGRDFLPGGMELSEAMALAVRLERHGVHLLDVSSGIGGWRRPPERNGEGYLMEEAAAIQSVVRCPVVGVGGVQTGGFVDTVVREGRVSLVAVGRAILEGRFDARS